MKKLIIFGVSEQAELAHYFFSTDSEFNVVGFVVDREFISDREFCGLPVVATDELLDLFPACEHDAFVAIGYSRVNATDRCGVFAVDIFYGIYQLCAKRGFEC
jgi:FlaA1/EpsC-like NDP-sugar epimerase